MIEIKCKRCGETRLIHEINDGIIGPSSFGILLDLNGSIVQASQNAASALGYKLNELFSMYVHQLNPSITLSFYKRLWQTCLKNRARQEWCTDTFYRAKNGSLVTLSTRFKFLKAGGVPYIFLILEVDPHKDNLVRTNDSWFGSLPDEIFFEIDTNGCCQYISQTAGVALGYTPEHLLGKSIADFCPLLRSGELHKNFSAFAKIGKPFEILNNKFTHANGEDVPLESYFISNYQDNNFSGYRVFNWIKGTG